MSDQYAVIGNPIAHSKSPWIHTEFAKRCDDCIEYGLLESEANPEAFAQRIRQFIAAGGKGANVTMPFKEAAWAMADQLSPRAKLAGAVNTLTFANDGQIFGDTTDGVGLVNDLVRNKQLDLKFKNILILGAGGAVKGVVQPLLQASPQRLHIVNRTVQRAHDLVDVFNDYGQVTAGGYAELPSQDGFDLIINATPANFSGELPAITPDMFTPDGTAYDMSYAAESTVFEAWCQNNGVSNVYNGLGMLVEQAAESYSIWRQKRPPTQSVLLDLQKSLKIL